MSIQIFKNSPFNKFQSNQMYLIEQSDFGYKIHRILNKLCYECFCISLGFLIIVHLYLKFKNNSARFKIYNIVLIIKKGIDIFSYYTNI